MRKTTRWFRVKAQEGDFGKPRNRLCPNIGRWAPEFAAGRWLEIMNIVFREGHEIVLVAANSLTSDQRSLLLDEWSKGKLAFVDFCSKKFAFWEELPYSLCALGLADIAEARRLLQEAYSKYLATQDAIHHRITKLFFEGELLREVQSFLDGADLSDLPLLRMWKAKLRFIPCNERSIEAKHGIVSKGKACNWTVNYASLLLRQPLMEHLLETREDFLFELANHCGMVRKLPEMLEVLQLTDHPALVSNVAIQGRLRHRDVGLAIYHADLETRFNVQTEAKKAWRKAKKMKEHEAKEFYKKLGRTSEQAFQTTHQRLLWRAATEHFQDILEPGHLYSCKQTQKPLNLLETLAALPTTLDNPMEEFTSMFGDTDHLDDETHGQAGQAGHTRADREQLRLGVARR